MKHYYRIAMMRTPNNDNYLETVDSMWTEIINEKTIEASVDFEYWLIDRMYYENNEKN